MNYRLTKFANGLRLLTAPQKEALSFSLLVLVSAGAKNESKEQAGISHFLEHLGFKGTTNRPSSLALASEFDSLGAIKNAYTSYDFTGYYVTAIPEKAERATELLADLYLNPLYPEEEIKKEKGVVLEEIKMYEDKPSSYIWDVFSGLAYGETRAGQTVLGDRGTVQNLTREDILAYRKKYYLASSTIIIAVGNFDETQMIDSISQKFAKFNGGASHPWPEVQDDQTEARRKLEIKSINQSRVVVGFKTVNSFSDKNYGLTVLAAYYIGAGQNDYVDHGFFSIYGGIDPTRIKEVLGAIKVEINKLKTELVSEAELTRVKDGLIGGLFLGLETPSDQTFFYGEQAILNKEILSPQEYADKIRAITAEELQTLAKEFFDNRGLNLAVVGPNETDADFLNQFSV